MLKEKIQVIKFRFLCFKCRCLYKKKMKHYLKTLKFCIYYMNKINVPVSKGDTMVMEALLSVFDESIIELNKNIDIYRKRFNFKK